MSKLTFKVTSADFQEKVLGSDGPVLVEFTAEWCPPCKMIAPLVEDIARQYAGRLAVGVLDTDANPDVGPSYGVMGIPTLILFVKGQPVQRVVGYRPPHQLEAAFAPYLETVQEDASSARSG